MFIAKKNHKNIVNDISSYIDGSVAQILIAEHTDIDIEKLILALDSAGVVFFGGIFPKIIYENDQHESGIIVLKIENTIDIHLVHNLDSKNIIIPNIDLNENENCTIITHVDGLSANISNYLSELFNKFGSEINYIGGGAGSLSLKQSPCIFTNKGLFQNTAVLVAIQSKISIGVSHGWKKIDGPLIATKTNENIIQEINWENAFDIYKKIVEKDSGKTFNSNVFFDIAKGYPFGLVKDYSEPIVRDPLVLNDHNEIICVGEVPENSVLNILKGDHSTLIKAAAKAANASLNVDFTPNECFVVDCISRVLFLEDNFSDELNQVAKIVKDKYSQIKIYGVLSLGEISSYDKGFLEFFNKTIVVSLFK